MTFYEIEIFSQPKFEFACTSGNVRGPHEGDTNIIDHRPNMLELSYSENVSFEVTTEYESFGFVPNSVTLYMPDCRYEIKKDAVQAMLTGSVAVVIDDMRYVRHSTEDMTLIAEIISSASGNVFFLPQLLEMPCDDFTLITSLFKTLINHYISRTATDMLRCLSIWYEICAQLDSAFRDVVFRSLPDYRPPKVSSAYYYVYKAKKYVCANPSSPPSLAEIAEKLNISGDYLGHIFKKETGRGFTDYVNFQRIQLLRELIETGGQRTFSESAAMAGLYDKRYAQRLFKKYYGISMRRCFQITNGISLLHENPWDIKNLDHDIFGKNDSRDKKKN